MLVVEVQKGDREPEIVLPVGFFCGVQKAAQPYNSGFTASVRLRSLRCNLQFGHVGCLRNRLRPHCKFVNPPPLYAMPLFVTFFLSRGQKQNPSRWEMDPHDQETGL